MTIVQFVFKFEYSKISFDRLKEEKGERKKRIFHPRKRWKEKSLEIVRRFERIPRITDAAYNTR